MAKLRAELETFDDARPSHPPDDDLPRDPAFDDAWRAQSREEPSAALDAAIRAAARRAVGAARR